MSIRFIIGIVSMSVCVVSFVLIVELVSGTYRTVIGILVILPVAISYIVTAGIAYITLDWRVMQLTVTIICLPLLLIWYHVPESPRWLLENGKYDKLKRIIITAARINKIKLPENYESSLMPSFTVSDPQTTQDTVSIMDMFRGEYRRITFLMIIVWFSLVLIYFGITLHLDNIGGNIYITTVTRF